MKKHMKNSAGIFHLPVRITRHTIKIKDQTHKQKVLKTPPQLQGTLMSHLSVAEKAWNNMTLTQYILKHAASASPYCAALAGEVTTFCSSPLSPSQGVNKQYFTHRLPTTEDWNGHDPT